MWDRMCLTRPVFSWNDFSQNVHRYLRGPPAWIASHLLLWPLVLYSFPHCEHTYVLSGSLVNILGLRFEISDSVRLESLSSVGNRKREANSAAFPLASLSMAEKMSGE